MQNQEIGKKVENLILEVLNIESLPLDASTENVEQWDSLAYLSIVSKLEKEFKLKIHQGNIKIMTNKYFIFIYRLIYKN